MNKIKRMHGTIINSNGLCINNNNTSLEKTADELFEELGYEKRQTKYFEQQYIRQCDIADGELEHIIFTKKKRVKCQYQYTDISKGIDMQELQAINKKCQELGWI